MESCLERYTLRTMPVYEYQCTSCEHRFEELVFNGSTLVACPSCTSTDLQKLLSSFARTRVGGDMPAAAPAAPRAGGGCCGGGCGCR
jgi:putative FmdB family regulatory protein